MRRMAFRSFLASTFLVTLLLAQRTDASDGLVLGAAGGQAYFRGNSKLAFQGTLSFKLSASELGVGNNFSYDNNRDWLFPTDSRYSSPFLFYRHHLELNDRVSLLLPP